MLQCEVNNIFDEMLLIITTKKDISIIFPQKIEDFAHLDDVKREQFIYLSKYILGTINADMSNILRKKILEYDNAFISLIDNNYGQGLYNSFSETLNNSFDNSYDIPKEVLDGCSVETILNTPGDFFPSDADEAFKKLISIIKLIFPFAKIEVKKYLEELIQKIKKSVERYNYQNLQYSFYDKSIEDIKKSENHFKSWVDLTINL